MDYQVIREARLREPFRPFWLRTKTGRIFHITEPEQLAVTPRALGVIDANKGGGFALKPADVQELLYEAPQALGKTS